MIIFVASFTDAWIETAGLLTVLGLILVASFTDAWIETEAEAKSILVTMSHLLQMRGLKLTLLILPASLLLSHLLQMRGLKHLCLNREHHWHSRIFYRCVD